MKDRTTSLSLRGGRGDIFPPEHQPPRQNPKPKRKHRDDHACFQAEKIMAGSWESVWGGVLG